MTHTRTIELGDATYTVERLSGRKATRVIALLRAISKATPGLTTELAKFRRAYEDENVVELDRVQAKVRYPPTPLMENGELLYDEHGNARMLPSPVDRLTEADWQAAGGKLRQPVSPSGYEVGVALFDLAVEAAEDTLYNLLALLTIPNRDVKRAWRDGTLSALVEERRDELLDDALATDLMELAVVAGEVIELDLRSKREKLGERVGNALRLAGLSPTSLTDPTSPRSGPDASTLSSSTASPAPTPDGDPTTSSTPPTTSSPSSADSSTTSASASSPPEREAAPA